ncbi:hypothetical protein Vretimale_16462 [Volvox reticuliferus]|uniref:Protein DETOXIFICATION n=1 Tax=Volvox reticuliferus TaxID=1737510 RepID=A0A8J4GU24_9CHLO|nr:hypothetical protein Vretifemale_8643 [Volvox reticuliferus]GIM13340.1 hypothetical protein Vretimale_16462 [Volvox reticuliferus]
MMYVKNYLYVTERSHSYWNNFRGRNNLFRILHWHQPQLDVRQTLVAHSSNRGSQPEMTGKEDRNLTDATKGLRHVSKLECVMVPVHDKDSSTPGDPPGQGVAAPGKSQSPYKDLRELDAEILSIGIPMLATLAADPIAGLVDSAYMGRAGSSQLAAVGVAISIFNTATKLFNAPLLAVTTSTVAKATGEAHRAAEAAATEPAAVVAARSAQVRSASACIWLAVIVGLLQAGLLLGAGPRLVSMWGVAAGSPVAQPALSFLLVRAAGAPVTILMLTLQGVFRGLQDTRIPLQATLVSNAINIVLAPIFIFGAGLGAVGAAIATVTAQVIPVVLMACELRQRLALYPHQQQQQQQRTVTMHRQNGSAGSIAAAGSGRSINCQFGERAHALRAESTCTGGSSAGHSVHTVLTWHWSQVSSMLPLFKPTGFLVLRSASVTVTYAVATSLVARGGPAVAASHQICFQLWLACSLLADALAVAAQSLMGRDIGAGSVAGAREVAARVSSLSLGLGLVLAGALASGWRLLPGIFSSDPEVLRLVTGLFPVIAAMQPITVLAMAWDGILYGAGGFRYAAVSMALAALPAMGVMHLGGGMMQKFAEVLGLGGVGATGAAGAVAQMTGDEQLWRVWAGIAVLMLLRWLTIVVPYVLWKGPFRQLRKDGI